MTTIQTPAVLAALDSTAQDRVQTAARCLYDAEVALHAARQSRVDEWIAAASNRLHEAVTNYRFALATRGY
jgi:hypothetical protein